jgi:hypothetical protein
MTTSSLEIKAGLAVLEAPSGTPGEGSGGNAQSGGGAGGGLLMSRDILLLVASTEGGTRDWALVDLVDVVGEVAAAGCGGWGRDGDVGEMGFAERIEEVGMADLGEIVAGG